MGKPISYDEDVYSWSARRAAASGSDPPVDWENAAEEIESVRRSESQALESALTRVIEHPPKLEYSPAVEPRAGRRTSVLKHRIRAAAELKDSPSLRGRLRLARVYRDGAKPAADGLRRDGIGREASPDECPWTPERSPDDDFRPENRFGLE